MSDVSLPDAFATTLTAAGGQVRSSTLIDVPRLIAELADAHPIHISPLVEGSFPGLADRLREAGMDVHVDVTAESARDQPVGLTAARAAIAETGSVILEEHTLEERAVSLLTRRLMVLCPLADLRPSLDDAAHVLREVAAGGQSFATLVSGPSRTADIERELAIGVQGPAELIVIFVDTSGGHA